MATSKEVAQYAEVLRATVSRILNGSARVSAETRTRTQLVVRQSTGPAPREDI